MTQFRAKLSTLATRLMNTAGGLAPRSWRRSPTALPLMGVAARAGLGTGNLRLMGRMPNGQTYIAKSLWLWNANNT